MQRMKNNVTLLATFQKKALCLAVAAAFSQAALANPLNPTVAAGSATFATNGNTLTVTNSPNAVINWQQFNIQQNETTRFVQQSAQSAVLNRIGGQNASQILGTLTSNGRVFLINPNGVMFGQGAVIDVAGLVASNLNLSDANFLANKLNFNGGGFGAVTNLGSISTPLGGSVYLIGSNVTNQGVITTPQGHVVLAAGSSVSLIDTGGPELSVTLTASGNKVVNLGTVNAQGGHIDMFGAIIEQQGVLRANEAVVDDAGRIVLKATDKVTVSGEITATNSIGKGGEVQVLGNSVTLTGTSRIDVSGAAGGGTALIGGDYQGKNNAIQNAQQTTIGQGATIKADALNNGNGGKVIVWADDKTVFDGYISARGGADGGDGGFVETSGKNSLQTTGSVNTLAPKGKAGEWLLDPQYFCLDNDAATSGLCYGGSINNFGAAGGISTSYLASALNSSNVSLEASDYIRIGQLNFSGGSNLTRQGARLSLKAPAILQSGGGIYTSSSSAKGLNLELWATGTSTTYGGSSGKIELTNSQIWLGYNDSPIDYSLLMRADNEIQLQSSTLSVGHNPAVSTDSAIALSAPKIVLVGDTTVYGGTYGINSYGHPHFNGGLYLETNKLSGGGRFAGYVSVIGVKTYTSGFNIYLGRNDAECGVSGLCLVSQIASSSWGGAMHANEAVLLAGSIDYSRLYNDNWRVADITPNGDIYIGYTYSWGVASTDFFGMIGRNITINPGKYINASGWASSHDKHVLAFVATNTFTNLGEGILNMPTNKYWVAAVGNYSGSKFGTMANGATVFNGYTLTSIDTDDSSTTGDWWDSLAATNKIFDLGSSNSLCTTNPTACLPTTPPKTNDLSNNNLTLNDSTNKTEGTLTVAADLKVSESRVEKKSGKEKEDKDKDGKDGKGEKGKADDKKKAGTTTQDRRAADEKKSPAELKREAQTLRADAKKSEADAKKSEAEARKSESEAKKSEAETKKADSEHKRAEGEAKKAEETGKKADAESKKHDSDAKQADAEAKNAKTPDAKANAESKKADAESKKADADSKKVEAEEKKVAADGKKSEVEHKKAETESKHKEAEAKHTEAESKKAEADSKQAEADSKLALAEAKEAKTPQQKQAAERRSDEKRIEAVQKKAEANVKKDQADAKKTEVDAKKAESEHKKTEADAKKTEADSKRAEGDAKKSESNAKKAESDGKKAEADSAKAKQEGKGGDEKKAEGKKQEAEQKKAQEEKKAEAKKQEAEAKKQEAEAKKQDAEKKKVEAETKKAEAEKKQAERRQESVKAFAKKAVAAMDPEKAAEMMVVRHEFKTEALKPALSVLERNPAAANLPACGSGSDVCVPAKAASAQQIAQIASQLPAPRIPTVSFLPQIERKIAVVVAINNYKDGAIPPLESAIPDGEAIGKLMASNLGYDVRVIRDGSKADIVKSLNAVGREVGPNDSVTVYYAGHGYQLPDKAGKPGEGYWIPADASAKSPDNWISNSDVSKLLANIPAKQVMLVSDSCYSGAFTKEQKVTTASNDPQKLLANRSVVVMSSGGEEPVSDEGKDGHSIFAWSLMQTLKNVDKFETGGQLYEGIRKTVIDEFPQVPQYGAATSAGHVAGGDYLFESRKY